MSQSAISEYCCVC